MRGERACGCVVGIERIDPTGLTSYTLEASDASWRAVKTSARTRPMMLPSICWAPSTLVTCRLSAVSGSPDHEPVCQRTMSRGGIVVGTPGAVPDGVGARAIFALMRQRRARHLHVLVGAHGELAEPRHALEHAHVLERPQVERVGRALGGALADVLGGRHAHGRAALDMAPASS